MNRQQPHATGESEKKKLETEEDKLGNHHNDPDHMVNEIWYKNVWRELKKQAKKIANSNTDEDSSPYKSMSIKTHATKKPLDSTRNKLKKNFVSDENLIFPSSEGVKIESWEKVSYSKIVPATDVLSDLRSPKQLKNAAADKRTFDCHGTTRPSDSIGNNFEKLFVSNENLAFRSLKGVEVNHESQKRDKHDKIEPSVQASMILEANCRYRNPPTPADSSHPSIPNQVRTFDAHGTRKPSDSTGNNIEEHFVSNKNLAVQGSKDVEANSESQKRDEYHNIEPPVDPSMNLESNCEQTNPLKPAVSSYPSIPNQNTGHEENEDTLVHEKDNVDQKEKINVLAEEKRRNVINRWKSIHSEDSLPDFKSPVDIITTSENTGEKPVELKNAAADKRSKDVSTRSNVYPNVIRDEISRMMTSIDIVLSEAKHLFGFERSQIFFDLLDEELCHFGSVGAISNFVPNMAESTVRQNVLSFVEHACDMMNRLMTFLSRCPDIKMLQQMPVQNFISLMKSVIKSSLKTQTKGREKLSSEGNTFIFVDSEELIRALGEEIPEDVLKRSQPSDRRDNRPIHSIYFPSDCRLFIYIPTENGSYWRQSDMRRVDRINQHGSMVNENGSKEQAKQIPSSEANTDASSNESLSSVESTNIRLYRNVIRNETSRMMSSTDMVMSEAEQLFGLERSHIFFDLLDEELFHFGSAGAISEFVPNMAASTNRQNVISFFEHAHDTMNRLMTLLLRCPDSKILQQMPVQNFISLMKSVIKSSQNTKPKGRKKLSLEGNIYTMVDTKEFERALGEEIPEDVLNRLRHGDETVVRRFVDTRQERSQPSERTENRPIHSIYFPSDPRLFVSIPTETGSYWHQLDMRRADRISRHGK